MFRLAMKVPFIGKYIKLINKIDFIHITWVFKLFNGIQLKEIL